MLSIGALNLKISTVSLMPMTIIMVIVSMIGIIKHYSISEEKTILRVDSSIGSHNAGQQTNCWFHDQIKSSAIGGSKHYVLALQI